MGFWGKIRTYLTLPANRTKLIIGGVVAFGVVVAVAFLPQLTDLFNRAPSQASNLEDDIGKSWDNLQDGDVDLAGDRPYSSERAHAKSIAVMQNGKRWLYVVGGLQLYTDPNTGEKRNRLLKTVQRIEIDMEDGSPVLGAQWEYIDDMNAGHAEFGLLTTTINSKPYLYVVAGDIHVPPVDQDKLLTEVPLLYSTMERLDLSSNTAQWEIVATITGVNFYPEVTMFNNRLQIVGGVYGNPFGPLENCGAIGTGAYGTGTNTGPNGSTASDPLDLSGDVGLWNTITKNKPVIGPSSPLLPVTATTGGVSPVINDRVIVNPNEPIVDLNEANGLNQQTNALTKWLTKLFAGTPKANAQSGTQTMQVIAPETGAILKAGINYSVTVSNIPANRNYIWIAWADSEQWTSESWGGNWNDIYKGSFTRPTSGQYHQAWAIPQDLKSNHVLIRVMVGTSAGGSVPTNWQESALSGRFSVGTSLAQKFSDALLSGTFVTTVSEWYSINLNSVSDKRIGELGQSNATTFNDFNGTFADANKWEAGKVMRLGHLRFVLQVVQDSYSESVNPNGGGAYPPLIASSTNYKVVPIPQGRYGHKLMFDSNKLLVVGGASWMPKIDIGWNYYQSRYEDIDPLRPWEWRDTIVTRGAMSASYRYFWVIEDAPFPTDSVSHAGPYPFGGTLAGPPNAYYVGHIAYSISATDTYWSVAPSYSFKQADGTGTKGRAFFGFAKAAEKQLVIGGLENVTSEYILSGGPGGFDPYTYFYNGRIVTQVTNRVMGWRGGSLGWVEDQSYVAGEKVYNLTAFSLGDRVLAYSGQNQFCASEYYDPHVPDPAQKVSNTMALYQDAGDPTLASWHKMADIGSDKASDAELGNGLYGEYYIGQNFEERAFVRNTTNGVSYDWNASSPFQDNTPADNFSIQWTGAIKSAQAGTYTFYVEADDGVSLKINNQYVIPASELYESGQKERSGSIELEANTKYAIELKYFEASGDAMVRLMWATPQLGKALIPQSRLYLPDSGGSSTGTKAGTPDIIFAADALVPTVLGGNQGGPNGFGFVSATIHNFYVYRYGGFQTQTAPLLATAITDDHQGIGTFTDALPGVPYPPNSSFTITPSTVSSDGYTPAVARVELRDYHNDPVANKHTLVFGQSPNNFPPRDTDDVKVTPFEGAGRDDGYDVHYLKTKEDGSVTFKLTSAKIGTYQMWTTWAGTPTSSEGLMGPRPVIFTDDNVPNQRDSSITTDKDQIVADNTDFATITVTLKGKKNGTPNSPLPGLYVKIASNRGGLDTITPASAVTNSSGQAVFSLKSATKGPAVISAVYAATATDLDTNPIPLSATVSVRFVGKIISLTPEFEKQGITIEQLTAVGSQTSWRDTTPPTQIGFDQPSNIDLVAPNGFVLDASPLSQTNFTLRVNNKPAGTNVQLTLEPASSGWGSFLPRLVLNQDRKQLTVTTNASGEAFFRYEHGSNTGALTLRVAVAGGETKTFKLMLADFRAPYFVSVTADPTSLDNDTAQSRVRASLYRWTGSGPVLIKDTAIRVDFVTDNGTVSPDHINIDGTTGVAETTYTRGSDRGNHNVFATISYDDYALAGFVTIGEAATAGGITFLNANVDIDPATQTINLYQVAVADTAPVGFWTFYALTDLGNGVFEKVTHPFQVLDKNAVITPYIESVSPNSVLPAQDQAITIKGKFTNFFAGSSSVIFTPYTNPNGTGITFASSDVEVVDRYTIRVTIDVANNVATMGYWNVKVDTNRGTQGHEIAELAGNTDLLVTTANGLILDIVASPNQLYRDGKQKSTLTTFTGKIDNLTGQITPIGNVDVTFSLEGGTGGTLQKTTDETNADGTSANTYTTDAGNESAEIYVRASATIEGTPVTDAALIIRIVGEGDFIQLVADPISLSLAGDNDKISELTATVTGADGNPIPNGTTVTFLLDGSGAIQPNQKATTNGVATSTYYRADGLLVPTSVTIIAKATIPNIGVVFSNQAVINIGLTDSDYNLNLVSDKTQVPVGGMESVKLTATLTYKGTPQRKWPVTFWLTEASTGDYLTVLSGRTNDQGVIESHFFAGIHPGNIIISARPVGLNSKSIAITKSLADQAVDPRFSTISAVPAYVPADSTAVSLITVTLRNSRYAPLAGKSVTVASNRNTTSGTVDIFSPIGAQTTDANGRVFFTVKSASQGDSQLRATIGSLVLGPAVVHFGNPDDFIVASFDIKVPLEAKAYDREIKIYLRETTAGLDPTINETYVTNPVDDKLTGVPEAIYLHPNKTYVMWAKGHYHLARTRQFNSPTTSGTTITLDFTDTITSKGLFAADLAGDEMENTGIFPGFNDNKINNLDIPVFTNSWFANSYLADLTGDFEVNILDISYWSANWFHSPGAPLP